MSGEDRATRIPLLKALKDIAKSGATLDASIVTTYAFNGIFYEEVLLRAFERAGSRLNIVLADAGQLAESMGDSLRRPSRAGTDYLLAPIAHVGAFHPKLVALLSEKQPIFALGSHNATDAGYSHNEEVTALWDATSPPPASVLRAAVEYALHWLESAGAVPDGVLPEITSRLRNLLPPAAPATNEEISFMGSLADASLWEQLRAKVSGPVRRVTVVGPYFDGSMSLLGTIEDVLIPDEIIIGIQSATAVLPQPDHAPKTARFVDASSLQAFWPVVGEVGFAHGKVLAIEGDGPTIVSFGSANPTGAAWLRQARWNAEANVCLTGDRAVAAFSALGLDRLRNAVALQDADLTTIAVRSRALRIHEREMDHASSLPPVFAGRAVDGGIFLAQFRFATADHVELLDVDGTHRSITLETIEGGTLLRLGAITLGGGLHELRSSRKTVAFILLNDAQTLRARVLPRDGARILDHLGALESGAGFTELLDLLDKYVLAPMDEGGVGASHATHNAAETVRAEDSDMPFGPRGVSLPLDQEHGLTRPRLSEGLIADIIAALIRALGRPVAAVVTDGDAPDLDEGDADGPSSDDLARNIEADAGVSEVDWPRLVTACRKRLTVMLRRLEARLEEVTAVDHMPSWTLGRLVVVLSLLRRLRAHPPQTRGAISGRTRPASLVSTEQLRTAFRLTIRALYGPGRLAAILESVPGTRGATERRLIDNLLLWFGREIGADYRRQSGEEADTEMLQARADIGLVAMSAASYETLEEWTIQRDPWLGFWDDAVDIADDWIERHVAYGSLLQRLRGLQHLPSSRPPVSGDLVIWAGERDLPWVVAALHGRKVTLTEPAGERGGEKKVLLASVSLLDPSTFEGRGSDLFSELSARTEPSHA